MSPGWISIDEGRLPPRGVGMHETLVVGRGSLVVEPRVGGRWSLVVGAMLVLGAFPLAAQSEPAAVAPRTLTDSMRGRDSALVAQQQGKTKIQQAPNCMRAQPSPLCRMWMLSEVTTEWPITTTRSRDPVMNGEPDFAMRAMISFGAMVNSGKNAWGAALTTGSEFAGPDYTPFSIEARYRRWVSRTFTLDAGAGYKRRQVLNDFGPNSPFNYTSGNGVTAFAAITPNRYVGVLVRGDVLSGGGRPIHAISLGLRSGWLAEKLASWGGSVFGQ